MKNKNLFKKILEQRFFKIPGTSILKSDYEQFLWTVKDISEDLKTNIINKFDTMTCNSSEFRSKFGHLSFKQAFIKDYFNGITPRCCFCGKLLEEAHNKYNETYIIADIEHVFPKSKFPQFTLHIDNWVPCCKECNEIIKKDEFFPSDPIQNFNTVLEDLHTDIDNMHPLELWKLYTINYDENLNIKINKNCSEATTEFLSFYGIESRIKIMAARCYDILLNIIRHSNIRSPESLERLLENMASSNWHEINDGYSLNNSPQIWQEFIENILYDECKLMALWDEVKSMNMSIF